MTRVKSKIRVSMILDLDYSIISNIFYHSAYLTSEEATMVINFVST